MGWRTSINSCISGEGCFGLGPQEWTCLCRWANGSKLRSDHPDKTTHSQWITMILKKIYIATEGRDVWACCEYLLQNRKPMAQRKNPGTTWNDLSAVCYPSFHQKKHPGLPYKYRPTALPQINGLEPMAGTWDHFHWKTSCLMPGIFLLRPGPFTKRPDEKSLLPSYSEERQRMSWFAWWRWFSRWRGNMR